MLILVMSEVGIELNKITSRLVHFILRANIIDKKSKIRPFNTTKKANKSYTK